MPRKTKREGADATELLKDLLIVQLGIAGVPQQSIRAIVGCDIVRVNRIARHLRVRQARRED